MNGVKAYQETAITTHSRGHLVVMLYEGAIKFLKFANRAIEQNDPAAKGKYIARAQDIILELDNVLDMEIGGEIAENLRKLYLYMDQQLSAANVKQDSEIINEVIGLLEELNVGWKTISEQ